LSSLLGLSRQSWLRTTITFIVGLILIALLCRVVDFHSLTSILRHTHFPLLALALATLFAFYVLRAFRWTIILQGKVGFLALFTYSSIGYLVSSVTPAQAGELVKPALVQARHGIPYFATAASVAVERLLDVIALMLLGLAAIFVLPSHALGPAWIVDSLKVGGALCASALLILHLGSRGTEKVPRLVLAVLAALRFPLDLRERITKTVGVFLQGTRGALSPLTLLLSLLCSLVVWAVHAVAVAVLYGAVNGRFPSAPVILLGFTVFSFGMAIPLTPAYVGQYEGLWLLVFTGLHVGSKSDVLSVGLLCHSLVLLTIALFGVISLGLLRRDDRPKELLGERLGPRQRP
jgi:uncharacterized protein (TIRG00374 family)